MDEILQDLKTSKDDLQYIDKIANRAGKEFGINVLSLIMDLEFIHAQTPLRLKEFSECQGFDFSHDIFGIFECFDRKERIFKNGFLPRFARGYLK